MCSVVPVPLSALSQAVSINQGDTRLECDAITDPEIILEWFGSLFRRIPGTDTLELAHFTVKDFLEQIADCSNTTLSYVTLLERQTSLPYEVFRAIGFSSTPSLIPLHYEPDSSAPYIKRMETLTQLLPRNYRAAAHQDNVDIARTCLTYLCFEDFDIDQFEDPGLMRPFLERYKLRSYCTRYWDIHARFSENEEQLLELWKRFLHSSRKNQYLSWISWTALIKTGRGENNTGKISDITTISVPDDENFRKLFAKLSDSSPLHFAAMFVLPSLSRWLIAESCDVNQISCLFGSPLLVAIS